MDLDAFKKYFNQKDAFSAYNGVRLTVLKKGYAEAEMDVGPKARNLLGMMHGGAYYTLADVAAGSAMIPYGKTCVTLGADIHYMRPACEGKVVAKAQVLQYGGRIGVARVEVEDKDGETLCVCTVTMYLTSKPIGDIPEEEDRP